MFSFFLFVTDSRWRQTVSRDQKTYISISPAELLDLEDFTDATLFANRKNYQVQEILTEVLKQSFQAIRVFFVVMLLFDFLLMPQVYGVLRLSNSLPTNQAHVTKEKNLKKRNPETFTRSHDVCQWAAGSIQRGSNTPPACLTWLYLTALEL